ncbi:hypothetical protein MRX96_027195 [Rhipicephalus microplus]
MITLFQTFAVLFVQLFLPGHGTIAVANKYERNKACLKPPTKENCTTVEYKWSFLEGLNGCYQNNVCSDHINNFEDKFKCARACPPLWRPLPPSKKVTCSDWLRGKPCYRFWFAYYPDIYGFFWPYMFYTGCREWKNKLYVYDPRVKTCQEIRSCLSCEGV